MEGRELIRKLGPKRVADRAGRGVNAVYNIHERIPARYYFIVKALCEEDGIDCPVEAFDFEFRPTKRAVQNLNPKDC